MSDYTVTTNFGAKDDLASGNAAKLIKGSEFTTEFDNIATAVATKADTSNPTFTGTVTIPTANISAGAIVATSLDLEDDNKIKLGTGDDLEIYHDASGGNSVIADVGTGALQLRGSAIRLLNADGTETLARFTADGASELHYDNSKKLETTASGLTVTGIVASDGLDTGDNDKLLLGDGDDLELYHGGTNSVIQNNTGSLKLLSDSIFIKNNADNEFMLKGTADGGVELYYDNGKKLETLSTGVKVTGAMVAGSKVGVGVDSPLKPLHVYSAATDVVGRFESGDATAGVEFLDNTGGTSSTAQVKNNQGVLTLVADQGAAIADSAISFNIDTTEKMNIGASETIIKQSERFNDDVKASFGTGNDLDIFHDGTHSHIHDNGTGALKIRGSSVRIRDAADANHMIQANDGAEVSLYYNGVKRFETSNAGVDVPTGNITLDTVKILTGSGAPAVSAPVGSLYLRTDGGADTTLYVKESGTGSSGWVAK